MEKSSKKKYIVYVILAIFAFLYLSSGDSEDGWTPRIKKKKKGKVVNVQDLRKLAFASFDAVNIPDIPNNLRDPFKSRSRAKNANGGQKYEIKREYSLKGIISKDNKFLAVILDKKGVSYVVGAGESFNGVKIISVKPNLVTLRDIYGIFSYTHK